MANGWPISTASNQGLGKVLKELIMTNAASMGTSSSSKLASGLLDTWEAIQKVPIYASGGATSGTGFGDTATPAAPEENNPFASNTAAQSQEFQDAAGVVPSAGPVNSPPPVSVADAAMGTAIQQSAAAALNTSVTITKPVFGNSQPVVFTPSGDALAPTTSPLDSKAHIEAPKAAPHAEGAPAAAPAPSASMTASKAPPAAAVQSNATRAAGMGRKIMP